MSEPFAYPSDIEDRWRPLSSDESDRAETLLDDASALIRQMAPNVDAQIAAGTLDPIIPLAIACAMVKRVMVGGGELDGVTQTSVTTGPFSNGATYANPMGNLYLSKAERKQLGVGTARAFSIDPAPDAGATYCPPDAVWPSSSWSYL